MYVILCVRVQEGVDPQPSLNSLSSSATVRNLGMRARAGILLAGAYYGEASGRRHGSRGRGATTPAQGHTNARKPNRETPTPHCPHSDEERGRHAGMKAEAEAHTQHQEHDA
jgi:hypothetical protein